MKYKVLLSLLVVSVLTCGVAYAERAVTYDLEKMQSYLQGKTRKQVKEFFSGRPPTYESKVEYYGLDGDKAQWWTFNWTFIDEVSEQKYHCGRIYFYAPKGESLKVDGVYFFDSKKDRNGKDEKLTVQGDKNGPYKSSHDAIATEPSKNGPIVLYWDDGNKKMKGYFKNGKPDGLWTAWHQNGRKKLEGHLKGGRKVGKQTSWHENGQKKMETQYDNGKRVGIETVWYANGKKKQETNFIAGIPNGMLTTWYESGQIKSKARMQGNSGSLAGSFADWNAKGQIVTEGYFKKGEESWRRYYKNGELHGLETVWDENGNTTLEIQYNDGKEVSRKKF